MSEVTADGFAECGNPNCYGRVDVYNPATIAVTYTLVPPVVGYYHSTCHDPWAEVVPPTEDPVNSPSHYRWLPNGIEVIDITETLNFTLGNAVKYILRADHKGKPEEDLAKAAWYIQRELERRKRDNGNDEQVV